MVRSHAPTFSEAYVWWWRLLGITLAEYCICHPCWMYCVGSVFRNEWCCLKISLTWAVILHGVNDLLCAIFHNVIMLKVFWYSASVVADDQISNVAMLIACRGKTCVRVAVRHGSIHKKLFLSWNTSSPLSTMASISWPSMTLESLLHTASRWTLTKSEKPLKV